MSIRDSFHRHVALPTDHGSWILLLGPVAIGVAAARHGSWPTVHLVLAALAGFLARQPITLAVKAYSGRRSRHVLPQAWFWIAVYGTAAAAPLAALILLGFGFVLVLALPGLPVLAWHLVLVARRAERRQQGVEVAAAGVLALAATGAYWVGVGSAEPAGWWLWLLCWAQSATAIVYAYMRLEQRALDRMPDWRERVARGRPALAWSTGALLAVLAFSLAGRLPAWLWVAYAAQWLEVLWGVSRPAVGYKPKAIGWRQLAVSLVFTVLFIMTWHHNGGQEAHRSALLAPPILSSALMPVRK